MFLFKCMKFLLTNNPNPGKNEFPLCYLDIFEIGWSFCNEKQRRCRPGQIFPLASQSSWSRHWLGCSPAVLPLLLTSAAAAGDASWLGSPGIAKSSFREEPRMWAVMQPRKTWCYSGLIFAVWQEMGLLISSIWTVTSLLWWARPRMTWQTWEIWWKHDGKSIRFYYSEGCSETSVPEVVVASLWKLFRNHNKIGSRWEAFLETKESKDLEQHVYIY